MTLDKLIALIGLFILINAPLIFHFKFGFVVKFLVKQKEVMKKHREENPDAMELTGEMVKPFLWLYTVFTLTADVPLIYIIITGDI